MTKSKKRPVTTSGTREKETCRLVDLDARREETAETRGGSFFDIWTS